MRKFCLHFYTIVNEKPIQAFTGLCAKIYKFCALIGKSFAINKNINYNYINVYGERIPSMLNQNLNSNNVKSFGILLNDPPDTDSGVYDLNRTSLLISDELYKYRCSGPVILDYVFGMSLLVIYSDDKASYFYLDRIILLNPGVTFSIVPMCTGCCVDIYTEQEHPLEKLEPINKEAFKDSVSELKLGEIYTFIYQETKQDFYFRGERHEPMEIMYVDKGEMHNIVDGHDILLGQQELVIIDHNSWHMQYSSSGVSLLTISFDSGSDLLTPITNMKLKASNYVKQLIEKMLHERSQQLTGSHDYLSSLLNICLIELLRDATCSKSAESVMPATIKCENQIIGRAVEEISKNIRHKYTVKDLAASINVSVTYLSRLFTTHLGMSPGKYITQIRLQECKALIREGELSIGEIAEQMGYASIQHFSAQFKNWFGLSPSEYAKSLL